MRKSVSNEVFVFFTSLNMEIAIKIIVMRENILNFRQIAFLHQMKI